MTTETNQVAEYSPTAAALAELDSRLKGIVYDFTAPKALDVAKKDRAELRTLRTNLEKKRQEIKAPALERCRLIDAEAKAITAGLEALEDPIAQQITKEEVRREEEKQAKIRAEQDRVNAIQGKINTLREAVTQNVGKSSAHVKASIIALQQWVLDEATFAEFLADAQRCHAVTISALEQMAAGAEAAEQAAEQARVAAAAAAEQARRDQEELQRLRAEKDQREAAERARLEQEAQARREAAEREEAERQRKQAEADAAARAEREEQARKDAEERARVAAAQEAERQRLADIEAKLERERRELDETNARIERERIARETQERAAEEERQRKIAAQANRRPTDAQIIEALALHFRVHEMNVIAWLLDMDLDAASKEAAKEFA